LASTAQNYFTRDWQSALGREKGAAFYTQVSCRAIYGIRQIRYRYLSNGLEGKSQFVLKK
jgi:hypothetical protein